MKIKFSPLALCLLLGFTACKKDPGFATGDSPGNVKVPSCRVITELTDVMASGGNEYTLTYDANGKLMKVTSAFSGTPIASVDINGTKIVRTSSDGTETFDFDKDIFSALPDAYSYANTNTVYPARSVKLNYNGKGKPTKVQNYDASSKLLNTLALQYDGSDNLSSVSISAEPAGSGTTTYTATSYGDKNSPYFGQTGAALLFYNWDYGSVQYTDLFIRLSRNNVSGWSLIYPTGSTTAVFKYNTVNDQGYPTDVTETVTSVNNGITSPLTDTELTYTYDCK